MNKIYRYFLIGFFSVPTLFSSDEIIENNVYELIQSDFESGEISYDLFLRYKMFVLTSPEKLPERYSHADVPFIRCGTTILHEIEQNLDYISEETRRIYRDLLEPPSEIRTSYYTPEGHFIIIYQTVGPDAPNQYDGDESGVPDYVENAGVALEYTWAVAFDDLEWETPGLGANQLVDITIEELASGGVLGYATGGCSNAQIHLDCALTPGELQVTSAHELHHTSQFCYDINTSWYLESTSMYMEDVIYDAVDDYVGYVASFIPVPWKSLDYFENGGLHQYGSVVWNFHIAEKYGEDAVRQVWLESTWSAIIAANSFFGDQGTTLLDEHLEFSIKCWMTGDRVNESHDHFEEAADWWFESPNQATVNVYPVVDATVADDDNYPDHLAWNNIKLSSTGNYSKLLVIFDGEDDFPWYGSTILVDADNEYTSQSFEFDENGDTYFVVDDWNEVNKLIFMPTNESTSGGANNAEYIFSAYELDAPVIQGGHEFTDLDGNGELEAGDDVELVITLTNYYGELTDAELELNCEHPAITIVDGISPLGAIPADGYTFDNTNDPFQFSIASNADQDFVGFSISLLENGLEIASVSVSTLIGIPDVLIVDDDDETENELVIAAALDSLGMVYQIKSASEGIESLVLEARNLVFWTTGDETTPLLSEEIDAISDYLDNVNSLVICGNHIASDLDGDDFLENYLKVQYVEKNHGMIMRGVEDDPIGQDDYFLITTNDEGKDTIIPAEVNDETTVVAINYSPGEGSLVRHHDVYNLVYCGFDIAYMTDTNPGTVPSVELITRILDWFDAQDPLCTKGDINADGMINVMDVMEAVSIILQTNDDPTPQELCAADLDDNDAVNVQDVMLIVSTILNPLVGDESSTYESASLMIGNGIVSFESPVAIAGVEIHAKLDGEITNEISLVHGWEIFESNQIGNELILVTFSISPKSVTADNLFTFSGILEIEEVIFSTVFGNAVPVETLQLSDYKILGNYPNPFNPETTIQFAAPQKGMVEIIIYNILGRVVAKLNEQIEYPGIYSVVWSGTDVQGRQVGSGVYFAVMNSLQNKLSSTKLLLIK